MNEPPYKQRKIEHSIASKSSAGAFCRAAASSSSSRLRGVCHGLWREREISGRSLRPLLDSPPSLLRHMQCTASRFYNSASIFNVEWSPEGNFVAAVTQDCRVLLCDPRAGGAKGITTLVENAHDNCVNVIKWIEGDIFATGSDDTTLKLFDLRTRKCVKTMNGHTGWVKNIEVLKHSPGLLVSTSFDGTIRKWDLKQDYPVLLEDGIQVDNILLEDPHLARMKLTQDGKTMVVSMRNGYMALVHDLDVESLHSDLPSGLSSVCDGAAQCLRMSLDGRRGSMPEECTRRKNRVELLIGGGKRGYSTSLQVDQGNRYILARRNLHNKQEECCIYDLQTSYPIDTALVNSDTLQEQMNFQLTADWCWLSDEDSESEHSEMSDGEAEEEEREEEDGRSDIEALNCSIVMEDSSSSGSEQDAVPSSQEERHSTEKMFPYRLLFTVQDSGCAEGYIKEPCFSHQGRFIASPYSNGVRIFDLQDGIAKRAESGRLVTSVLEPLVTLTKPQLSGVLTCQWHPFEPTIASGSTDGVVNFYSPQL